MTDKKRLIENFSAMGLLQILNFSIPFITLPYLVRVLGPEGYGIYIFSTAFVTYFIILTDFGFELSASREVALNRHDKKKLSEILSSVLIIKVILAIISLIIFITLILIFEGFRNYWFFHLLTFSMVFGNILLSYFYYQGIERMKFIAVINVGMKLFFTVLIFVFVKDKSDLNLVPTINSIGYITAGAVSIYFVIRTGIKIKFPGWSIVISQFKNSIQFFWSRLSVSMYTTSNSFIIGLVLGPVAVGVYGAAEKLFVGFRSIYGPVSSVLYPYLTYSKNIKLYKKILKYIIIINTIISLFVLWNSDFIIHFIFGANFSESVPILKIMSLISIIIVPSILMGYPLFSAFDKTHIANKSVIYPSILHVLILVLLIPVLTLNKVVLLLLFTEVLVFLGRLYGAMKYKLLRTN